MRGSVGPKLKSPTKALECSTSKQGVEKQTRAKDRGYVYIRRDEAGRRMSKDRASEDEEYIVFVIVAKRWTMRRQP